MKMENEELLYRQHTFKRGPKPSASDNQKRRIFFVLDCLIGIVGFLLFVFSVIVSFKHGWSGSGYNDISTEIKTALYMLAIFALFTSAIGGFGAYTRWKTLIVTFTILSLMCLAFQVYIVFSVMDVQKNAFRDMARAWWDKIDDDTKVSIQNANNCCGYLNIRDNAVVSNVCPKETIELYTIVAAEVKDPADVIKKDSYFKQNQDKINIKTTAGTVSTVNNGGNAANTNPTTAQGPNTANTGANTGANTQADTKVDTSGDAQGEGGDDQGEGGDEDEGGDEGNELKRRQAADTEGAGETADTAADPAADTTANTGANTAANAGANTTGNPAASPGATANANPGTTTNANPGATKSTAQDSGLQKGRTTGDIDPSVPGGCSEILKSAVETKLKLVYIVIAALCAFYPIGSIMGYVYWKALRDFKEFDEFA